MEFNATVLPTVMVCSAAYLTLWPRPPLLDAVSRNFDARHAAVDDIQPFYR